MDEIPISPGSFMQTQGQKKFEGSWKKSGTDEPAQDAAPNIQASETDDIPPRDVIYFAFIHASYVDPWI